MTREEMESRRVLAAGDIKEGMSAGRLSKQYEVSRTTAYRWREAVSSGKSMASRKATGRVPKLTPASEKILRAIVAENPDWRASMVADALRRACRVKYSRDHIPRLLRRLGMPVAGAHKGRTGDAV